MFSVLFFSSVQLSLSSPCNLSSLTLSILAILTGIYFVVVNKRQVIIKQILLLIQRMITLAIGAFKGFYPK